MSNILLRRRFDAIEALVKERSCDNSIWFGLGENDRGTKMGFRTVLFIPTGGSIVEPDHIKFELGTLDNQDIGGPELVSIPVNARAIRSVRETVQVFVEAENEDICEALFANVINAIDELVAGGVTYTSFLRYEGQALSKKTLLGIRFTIQITSPVFQGYVELPHCQQELLLEDSVPLTKAQTVKQVVVKSELSTDPEDFPVIGGDADTEDP